MANVDGPFHKPIIKKEPPKAPLQRAWDKWFATLPLIARTRLDQSAPASNCTSISFKPPYLKYDNLLVLNSKAFERHPLNLIWDDATLRVYQGDLWKQIAESFGIHHVGLTAPIPLHVPDQEELGHAINGSNVLRSPTSFQPLLGDFGDPGVSLFSASVACRTFWASATQHGIMQIWSPLHTMFSNGNVTEKQRVTTFQSSSRGSTAVDLYAGIGYFAFFYRKCVASVVLCWEINEWSIEGFRRGANVNGWGKQIQVVREHESFEGLESWKVFPRSEFSNETGDVKEGLVMFAESNERAIDRIDRLRQEIPPVQHVNCGYLPTSSPSWETAVRALDPYHGGWVHAHENIALIDIEKRTKNVVREFERLASKHALGTYAVNVKCEHVARVKTYAPGVMHCVLDIRIEPRPITPR